MKTVARGLCPGFYFTLVRLRYLLRILWFSGSLSTRLEFVPRVARSFWDELRWYVEESWLRRQAVECPLCRWSGSSFRPVLSPAGQGDTSYRPKAVCPGCLSRERHRFSISLMKREFAESEPQRVLHFAPEQPIRSYFATLENSTYLSVDIAANGCMAQMDIRHLALPDEHYDFVYCSHVLQAVSDVDGDLDALREIRRVLKPGGRGMLMVTEHDLDETLPLDQPCTADGYAVRRYGRDFMDRVRSTGLTIEVVEAEQCRDMDFSRLGLRPERVFVIEKT